jgi:hypothetical protein
MKRVQIALTIPSDWERIDLVRQTVSSALSAVYASNEITDALSMVSAELLENAVKYGRPDNRGIEYTLSDDDGSLVVAVTNGIDEERRPLSDLKKRLDWIAAFPDPSEAYVAALSQIYNQTNRTEGGLGLIRVSHEGGCKVRYVVNSAGRLTVIATRPTSGSR